MDHGIDTGFLVAAEVLDHPNHHAAWTILSEIIAAGDHLALAPQVLAEFIHVVTDPRRFATPLTMEAARDLAQKWWSARDVRQVVADAGATTLFFTWHRTHELGRKRILDTLLAATYRNAGIKSLLTTNPRDFAILGGFQCTVP